MSSNFPHYAPLGSSVPNDYAIVAHFAASHDGSVIDSDVEEYGEESDHDTARFSPSTSPRRNISGRPFASTDNNGLRPGAGYGTTSTSPSRGRRMSAGVGRRGLHRPSMESTRSPVVEETDPLLDIPRLVEADDTSTDEPSETWQLWLQELKVVSKYTLPVFG